MFLIALLPYIQLKDTNQFSKATHVSHGNAAHSTQAPTQICMKLSSGLHPPKKGHVDKQLIKDEHAEKDNTQRMTQIPQSHSQQFPGKSLGWLSAHITKSC